MESNELVQLQTLDFHEVSLYEKVHCVSYCPKVPNTAVSVKAEVTVCSWMDLYELALNSLVSIGLDCRYQN